MKLVYTDVIVEIEVPDTFDPNCPGDTKITIKGKPCPPVDATPTFDGTFVFGSLVGLIVTFDQTMQYDGFSIPAWTVNGQPITGFAETSPGSGQFTVTATGVTPSSTFVVPANDPAIRVAGGGYVKAGTYPIV